MQCQLCERDVERLTAHHLIPRSRGGLKGNTVDVCVQCSKQIHAMYDNKTLERKLNTLEKLKNDEKMRNYLMWVKNKRGSFKTKRGW